MSLVDARDNRAIDDQPGPAAASPRCASLSRRISSWRHRRRSGQKAASCPLRSPRAVRKTALPSRRRAAFPYVLRCVEPTTQIYNRPDLLLPLPGNDPRIRCHIRDRLDLALRCGLDLAGANSARIVDQDVKATECVERLSQGECPAFNRADVRGDPGELIDRLLAELVHSGRDEGRATARDSDGPFAKRALAIAKPVPLEPPVIRTRFPSSFMAVVLIRPADSWTGRALASLLVVDLLEGVVLADGPGAQHRRTRIDGFEQPLQVGKGASGSSSPLRTRDARSSQPQAEISAIV